MLRCTTVESMIYILFTPLPLMWQTLFRIMVGHIPPPQVCGAHCTSWQSESPPLLLQLFQMSVWVEIHPMIVNIHQELPGYKEQ